jgi:DNA repair ATPase RecN
VTFARLKDLQRDLRFWAAGLEDEEADPAELEKFKHRLDHILEESLKYWMKIRGAPDLERAAEEAMPQVRQENAPP